MAFGSKLGKVFKGIGKVAKFLPVPGLGAGLGILGSVLDKNKNQEQASPPPPAPAINPFPQTPTAAGGTGPAQLIPQPAEQFQLMPPTFANLGPNPIDSEEERRRFVLSGLNMRGL